MQLKQKLFPILLIVLQIGAAIVSVKQGDIRKGIYWFAAAVLNISVTF